MLVAVIVVSASLWAVLFWEGITFAQLLREVGDALATWAANLYEGFVNVFKALSAQHGARRR